MDRISVCIVKREIEEKLVNTIQNITMLTDNITYSIPDELQNEIHHKELFELNSVKTACKAMTKKPI